MKNRKTLYILIPSVALIWGLIIWKVLDFEKEEILISSHGLSINEVGKVDTTHYKLTINYGDPFLRRARQTKVAASSQPAKRENRIKKVDMKSMTGPVKPVGLVYRGLISCNEERIGLLEFGEQKRLIKEKSMIGEYKIISVENDSLTIVYQEKEYVYGKQ